MKRVLFITLVVLAVLIGVGGLVYAFGTPQAPDVAADAAAPGAPAAELEDPGLAGSGPGEGGAPDGTAQGAPGAGGAAMGGVPAMGGGDPSARGKEAPPADPNSPLAIQIPGCVCHSDDPKLVEEHANYRMNQCYGCHSGGAPTGE